MQRTRTFPAAARRAWGGALAWLIFVYGSIPLARSVQELAQTHGLRRGFLWLTGGALVVAALSVAVAFRRGVFRLSGARAAWLLVLFGGMGWLVWSLRGNPEEAFHVVQYGVLGVLVYRALRHHLGDPSVYLLAAVLVATAGTLDELIQWITPARFFDFRDMGINVLAGSMVMAVLALGLRPEAVRGPWSIAGLRATLGAATCGLALLFFCTVNTQEFKVWYSRYLSVAERIPGGTAEYGYRIVDPELGVFFSRMSREILAYEDATRGADVANLLGRYRSDAGYKLFLGRYAPEDDPLAYEARVRLFRRDHHALLCRGKDLDARRIGHHAFIAHREDAIMNRYFPVTMKHYTYAWSEEFRALIASLAVAETDYTSPVSSHLIPLSPPMLKGGLAGLLVCCWWAGWRLGRKESA